MDWQSQKRSKQTKMSEIEAEELVKLRSGIAELMGQCILKLQNYELRMKHFLATSELGFNTGEISASINQRKERYSGQTLGMLVKEFTGSYVSKIDQGDSVREDDDGFFSNALLREPEVRLRFSNQLNEESHQSLTDNLRDLVNLRNDLVHHFLLQHPLSSLSNFLDAKKYLTDSLALINHHNDLLSGLYSDRKKTMEGLRQVVASSDFHHYVSHGFLPGQTIQWDRTPIVEYLKDAEFEFQNDGWTELLSAISWIKTKAPHLSPKSHGCASWRSLLHTSSLFEIRKIRHEGSPTKTLYRSR
jgi:hypothetical protein